MRSKHSMGLVVVEKFRLDADLQYFNALIDCLRDFCNKPLQPEAEQVLHDIQTFLVQRFEFEIEIMEFNQHQDLEFHRQQHEYILKTLLWSIMMIHKAKYIMPDLCDFLSDWFRFHSEQLDADLCGLLIPQ